jgi:hypothetical protein
MDVRIKKKDLKNVYQENNLYLISIGYLGFNRVRFSTRAS